MLNRVRKAWNGGSREAALAIAHDRTERAIASGCPRCNRCNGAGALQDEDQLLALCPDCGGAGYLVPPNGMPMQTGEWRCAGCGALSDSRQRICNCVTNVVVSTKTGRSEWKRPHWAVTVWREGEEIVTIESNSLSGREITPDDEDAIRTAAHHLLSFIGNGCP